MRTRQLGRITEHVSEIGLGTAQLANTTGNVKGVKRIDLAEARAIIALALDEGVTFFDTSDSYGSAETILGEIKSSKKDKIIIATKAGYKITGERNFTNSYLLERIEESSKKLNSDALDLFQLNKPSVNDLEDGRLFEFLGWLKQTGRSQYCGVVVGDLASGKICLKSKNVDCIQVLYNLLYLETEELISEAHKAGIGVIARSPLNSGILSGVYTTETSFSSNDERSKYFSQNILRERLEVINSIFKEIPLSDKTILQFALSFILSNSHVSVTTPGASTIDQLRSYLDQKSQQLFSTDELTRIKKVLFQHLAKIQHTFQN